jgi:2-polyprenyl-3-methyl-5-hydroxy-6-metoxy-1,4-benzoquinol methylase
MNRMKPLWRQVLSLYGHTSLGFAIKFFIRWKHGDPFERLERYFPPCGRIVDVGCGSGFFANLLAVKSLSREVFGVDIDERQIRSAQSSIGTRTNISFAVRDLMKESLPPSDIIVAIDVLHHMRFEEQDRILRVCREAIGDKGTFFLLDVDILPRWKHYYDVAFDSLTGLLGITRGSALSYQGTAEMTERLYRAGFGEVQVTSFAQRVLSPRVLFVAKPKSKG